MAFPPTVNQDFGTQALTHLTISSISKLKETIVPAVFEGIAEKDLSLTLPRVSEAIEDNVVVDIASVKRLGTISLIATVVRDKIAPSLPGFYTSRITVTVSGCTDNLLLSRQILVNTLRIVRITEKIRFLLISLSISHSYLSSVHISVVIAQVKIVFPFISGRSHMPTSVRTFFLLTLKGLEVTG